MFEKLEECPACRSPKFDNHLICKDQSVSGESFALVKCVTCNLIFTNPRPSSQHIEKYYKNPDYISHTNNATNVVNWIYKIVRLITIRNKYSLISKSTANKSILDFGCGTGHFLRYCQRRGLSVRGLEPDLMSREQASSKTNTLVARDFNDLPNEKYDIITAWHVLEHVRDLNVTLKEIRQRLTTHGTIYLAVPNPASFDAQHYKQHWAGYDVPRHFYHFTGDSIEKLFLKHKLKLIKTLPMLFDSYYVSLLSEKNCYGRLHPKTAFLIGRKSNQLAIKTGHYSSLIYILSK